MIPVVRQVELNRMTGMHPLSHYADTFALDGEDCPMCCELAFEAWERMTYGGVVVDWYPTGTLNVLIRNGRVYAIR